MQIMKVDFQVITTHNVQIFYLLVEVLLNELPKKWVCETDPSEPEKKPSLTQKSLSWLRKVLKTA